LCRAFRLCSLTQLYGPGQSRVRTGQALVNKEPSEEEAHQESEHHKEDNDWSGNVAHNRLIKQDRAPSQSQGEHDARVLRGWELPQSFALGGGGRTDIESPLGRHQGGLRNTLCHCLLMNHPVRLRSRGEEVLQERPGLAVAVIPVMDLGCCLGHKRGVLLAGIIETPAVLWVRGYQVRRLHMGWQQVTRHSESKMHVSALMVTHSGTPSLVTDI
jgi:hypothetical protein